MDEGATSPRLDPRFERELKRVYAVDRDLPCPACGYNLRGLMRPICPECGADVEEFVRVIETSPRRWRVWRAGRVRGRVLAAAAVLLVLAAAGAVVVLYLLR